MSLLDRLSASEREQLRTAEPKACEQPMLAVPSTPRRFSSRAGSRSGWRVTGVP